MYGGVYIEGGDSLDNPSAFVNSLVQINSRYIIFCSPVYYIDDIIPSCYPLLAMPINGSLQMSYILLQLPLCFVHDTAPAPVYNGCQLKCMAPTDTYMYVLVQ